MIHTNLPDHKSEREFANSLTRLDSDTLDIWFNLNHIPGTNDIDVFLIEKSLGAFLIEVKGVSLQMIKRYGLKECVIEGRNDQHSPTQQALKAMFSLKNFLEANSVECPYIIPTAAFPKISRSAWENRWGNSNLLARHSQGLIFSEDVLSYEAFFSRLQKILQDPPIGTSDPRIKFRYAESRSAIRFLDETLAPSDGSMNVPQTSIDDINAPKMVEPKISELLTSISATHHALDQQRDQLIDKITDLSEKARASSSHELKSVSTEINALIQQHQKLDTKISELATERQYLMEYSRDIAKKIESQALTTTELKSHVFASMRDHSAHNEAFGKRLERIESLLRNREPAFEKARRPYVLYGLIIALLSLISIYGLWQYFKEQATTTTQNPDLRKVHRTNTNEAKPAQIQQNRTTANNRPSKIIRASDYQQLETCLGHVCNVTFQVMSSADLSWGMALNSKRNYRDSHNFQIILKNSAFPDDSAKDYYLKTIRVTGKVQEYDGRLQIIVGNRKQISVH